VYLASQGRSPKKAPRQQEAATTRHPKRDIAEEIFRSANSAPFCGGQAMPKKEKKCATLEDGKQGDSRGFHSVLDTKGTDGQ